MKTHTIHRSIDLEDTLTLQVTRPTKKNNLACLLQSTLHLMQIEGIRYRYSLIILLLFADWMAVTHIHEEFVCAKYNVFATSVRNGVLDFDSFLLRLNNKIDILRTIAFRSNRLSQFKKTWDKLL